MIVDAADIVREWAKRNKKSVMVGRRGNRVSYLSMSGRNNGWVNKGTVEVTASIFSLRSIFREISGLYEWAAERDREEREREEVILMARILEKQALKEGRK